MLIVEEISSYLVDNVSQLCANDTKYIFWYPYDFLVVFSRQIVLESCYVRRYLNVDPKNVE